MPAACLMKLYVKRSARTLTREANPYLRGDFSGDGRPREAAPTTKLYSQGFHAQNGLIFIRIEPISTCSLSCFCNRRWGENYGYFFLCLPCVRFAERIRRWADTGDPPLLGQLNMALDLNLCHDARARDRRLPRLAQGGAIKSRYAAAVSRLRRLIRCLTSMRSCARSSP